MKEIYCRPEMEYENYVNHIKLFYIVMKMGGDVFVQTLKTLYTGPQPMYSNLVDFADVKSSNINKDEKELLENIKSKERDLKALDITLSYKLIQLTCGLQPRQTSFSNSCLWSKRCPKEMQSSVEYLLFRYKTERNQIVHQFTGSGGITDEVFRKLKDENMELLKLIVETVGTKANLSKQEIKMRKNRIEIESDSFCQQLGMGGRNLSAHSEILEDNPELKESKKKKKKPKNETDDTDSDLKEEEEEEEGEQRLGALPSKKGKKKSFSFNCFAPSKRDSKPALSPPTPIDYSPVITKTILTAFGKDFEGQEKLKPYEKSNRVFWVNKLVADGVLQDQRKLKSFWKEYEKNSS